MLYCFAFVFFVFKQKTAYEMRISDWSSDVCSSDLQDDPDDREHRAGDHRRRLDPFPHDALPLVQLCRKGKTSHPADRSAAPREISRDDMARRYGETMWRARGEEAAPFVLYAVLQPADCVKVHHCSLNRSNSTAQALSPGDPTCTVRRNGGEAGERGGRVNIVTY